MKVISYFNVVPRINKSQEKFDILAKFPTGVHRVGDVGLLSHKTRVQDCDVAVIQGWQHERGKSAPHLKLRQEIIDHQRETGRYVCTADANLFLYANKSNKPHHYLRYSFNGVFPTTGIYFDDNPDPSRWQQISTDCDIQLEDYKKGGKNIVLCCQRDGGWSMGAIPVLHWARSVISQLKVHTDRQIVIRPHPKDKRSTTSYLSALKSQYKNDSQIKISNLDHPLEHDLDKAWAVINHNSSSIVGPLIQGFHAFVTDPANSQNAEVVNTDLSLIESPLEFDREKWLQRISMFHWKFSELEDGSAWRHMRQYVI